MTKWGERIRAVLDDQRLVSLDNLFGLYDGLGEMAKGAKKATACYRCAGTLREFEMPRPIFTEGERVDVVTGRSTPIATRSCRCAPT